MNGPDSARRTVRSFVRREGRMTRGQQRALSEWLPVYGIPDGEDYIDLRALFGRDVPVIIEIGTGNGDVLVRLAAQQPECDFLGVEVFRPGVGQLLRQVRDLGLTNVRVALDDAVHVLERRIPPASLTKILIFFPDPWPKKRHHKRRLLQPAFAHTAALALIPGGQLHVATDWEDYAEHIRDVLEHEPLLSNTADGYAPRPGYRSPTKYESRGEKLGHDTRDLIFARIA